MVVALITAPLFHSHERDDHGTAISVVHAHFLEAHEAEHHPEDEIEAPHGHDARWIDFFTFQPPSASFELAVEITQELSAPVLERREGVVFSSAPTAHSPPDGGRSAPRSPPTI